MPVLHVHISTGCYTVKAFRVYDPIFLCLKMLNRRLMYCVALTARKINDFTNAYTSGTLSRYSVQYFYHKDTIYTIFILGG